MSMVNWELSLKEGLHQFPQRTFGSPSDLTNTWDARERDTLIIACSELGTAPDNISFAEPNRALFCSILQRRYHQRTNAIAIKCFLATASKSFSTSTNFATSLFAGTSCAA